MKKHDSAKQDADPLVDVTQQEGKVSVRAGQKASELAAAEAERDRAKVAAEAETAMGSAQDTVGGKPIPDGYNGQHAAPQFSLPPGYMIDPATGQPVYVGGQYVPQRQYPQPGMVYFQVPQQPVSQQLSPEQIAAQHAADQKRYGQVVQSVEKFIGGEGTVSDVVKTLYLNSSQNDQLWKGVVVGAAAAVLLTSGPVREVMGKGFTSLFPGLMRAKNDEGKDGAMPNADLTDEN
ncbi:MAG: hypothetical protein ACK5PS_19860 [Desulfopila sp.]